MNFFDYRFNTDWFILVVYFSILRETGRCTSVDETDKVLNTDGIPTDQGESLELCAGLIDKDDFGPAETAVSEVLEECGYKIRQSDLRFIDSFR